MIINGSLSSLLIVCSKKKKNFLFVETQHKFYCFISVVCRGVLYSWLRFNNLVNSTHRYQKNLGLYVLINQFLCTTAICKLGYEIVCSFPSILSPLQTEEFDEVQKKIREKFEKMFPDRLSQPVVSTTLMRRIEWRAACVIQKAIRIFLENRAAKRRLEVTRLFV